MGQKKKKKSRSMNSNASTTVPNTVPIKFRLAAKSCRRARIEIPLTMSAVTRKLATCFPELKPGQFSIQYQDEEGDKILVTNDADLAEALDVFKALGRVLSFSVLPNTSKSDESDGCEKSAGHEFAQKHFVNHWRKHWQNQRGCHERHGGCGRRWHRLAHMLGMRPQDMKPQMQNMMRFGMLKHFCGTTAVHHGVSCDGSNQNPLLGVRYHKIGHNYDLNATEFAKLSPTEQNKYEKISRPGATPVPVVTALPTEKIDLDCKFVADATIPDHAVVPSQQHFEKKWIVKTGPKPWPAGCVLTHVGGHPMGTKASKAKPAPLGPVPANAEVELAVVLKAPKPSRDIVSKWRVCTPDGRQFGDFLWALINVESLKSASAAELPPAIPVAAAKPVAAAAKAVAKTIAPAAKSVAKPVAAAAKAVAKTVTAAAKAVAKTVTAAAKAVAKPAPVPVATATEANESANLRTLMEMNFPVPTEVLAYILESTGDDLNAAIALLLAQSE